MKHAHARTPKHHVHQVNCRYIRTRIKLYIFVDLINKSQKMYKINLPKSCSKFFEMYPVFDVYMIYISAEVIRFKRI